MSDNIVKYVKGQCSYIGWLNKRLKNNKNALILMYGQTGSGKTYSAIRKAWELDPTFDVRQIVFSFVEFMEVINSDWFKAKPIKQVVFDEPQVSMNSRTWQSITNRIINHLLSTFRSTQIIVYFCCPYKDFLDSQSMKLIHCCGETKGINRDKNKCRVKLSFEEYNSSMQKYYHHPLLVNRAGQWRKLREIHIKLPPKELYEPYEVRKKAFNDKINAEIMAKAKQAEDADKPKQDKHGQIGLKPLTLKQKLVFDMLNEGQSVEDIAKAMKISPRVVNFHLDMIGNKGYSLKIPTKHTNEEILPT